MFSRRDACTGAPIGFAKREAPYVVLTMYPDAASVTADISDNKALAQLVRLGHLDVAALKRGQQVCFSEVLAVGQANRFLQLAARQLAVEVPD